jgi:hypothetical protein
VAANEISKADVLDVNETDESSARYYLAELAKVGIDPATLSFTEIVSVTRKCHGRWQRSDERRDELEIAKAEREEVAKRERLANLAKKRDALLAASKRDAERARKREEALAELRAAGLLGGESE